MPFSRACLMTAFIGLAISATRLAALGHQWSSHMSTTMTAVLPTSHVTSDSIDWYWPPLVAESACERALNVIGAESAMEVVIKTKQAAKAKRMVCMAAAWPSAAGL